MFRKVRLALGPIPSPPNATHRPPVIPVPAVGADDHIGPKRRRLCIPADRVILSRAARRVPKDLVRSTYWEGRRSLGYTPFRSG